MVITLSIQEARHFALHQQGLLSSTQYSSTIESIEQLGYIQIDTISVMARAHHHVLHSRNPYYHPDDIDQLVESKKVFEYWSHAAAYLPMRDYHYSLYRKQQYQRGEKHWFQRDKKVERYVMERIANEGPLQSKDFEYSKSGNHDWYSWKPAKIALTNLFMDGSLMIRKRQGFQKVFDLTDNVISDTGASTQTPSIEEYSRYLIDLALNAHGFMDANEISYLRKGIKQSVKRTLLNLIENGDVIEVRIEGGDKTYYAFKNSLEKGITAKINECQVHLLSPFDNAVIQRKRTVELFGFDYFIECYVPEKKRQYGYYCIPVLYGDRFVARFDAKANRKTGQFVVKKIWYEVNFKADAEFLQKFNQKLQAFATFCACSEVIVS